MASKHKIQGVDVTSTPLRQILPPVLSTTANLPPIILAPVLTP